LIYTTITNKQTEKQANSTKQNQPSSNITIHSLRFYLATIFFIISASHICPLLDKFDMLYILCLMLLWSTHILYLDICLHAGKSISEYYTSFHISVRVLLHS